MEGKVKCTCGWSWNKSDSSKKDMYICHECGRDNSNNISKAQEGETLSAPPKSQYKRLYGHAKDYSQGENKKMKIDPDTGYGYFPPELSTVQQKEVPNSPWNTSRFLFDPFIRNESQGVHNAKYDKEGNMIDNPREEDYFSLGSNRGERYDAAKKDITNYYKEDLKQNDDDVEKNVDDTMDLIRKMRRTEEMMQRHNATYKDFQNYDPQEVFKSAVGFDELFPSKSMMGDKNLSPAQAKRAYKMFQKTWRGVSGKEARQNSREELKKAQQAFELAKEQKEEGFHKPDSNYVPEDFANGGILKNGGWLDNYNDSQASAPEGMVGDGFSNVGRNYSPAWGGSFQMGGSVYPVNYVPQAQEGKQLTFLQPNSDKLPQGYRIPYSDPSSERAMSIGGENGEPAYLIPSFKYGQPLYNAIEEFRNTGEHLGGPFKTHQEADQWEQDVRHPYVEKGQAIPMPIKTWGEMAMGGTIPGAVGFSYARTQGAAPSNGKYAKKTMASAQNGDKLNPFNYPRPDHYSGINPFLVRDPEHGIFVGGVNPTYSTDDFSIGASVVGVGNKDFQKLPADYGIRGSYNPSKNLSINANLSKNNVGAGMSYRFENGGEMKYYQQGLDWQPKTISKNGGWLSKYEEGGIVKGDQDGYRNPKNRGKVVEIIGDTMGTDGYDDTLYVVPDVGEPRIVHANTGNHTFPGATKFTEYPIAQDGYTTGNEVKYGTPEYEEAYKRGEVFTEDGQYSPIELEEVVVQGKPLTEFGKTRKDVAEKNTWEQFANDRYLGNFEKNMGQTLENLPEYRKQEYEDYVNKLAFDEYVKTHPQAKGEKRGEYIDRIQNQNTNSSNFERAYEANAEYNPSTDVNLWRKSLMGLGSFAMGTPAMNKLKQNSDYYSTKEKQYIEEHPVASAFDTTLGTLAPLEIPGNMLYGRNNSALEALSGRGTDVPMEARILGDPLMVVGEAAPLIGKGLSYLGNKGSQALAKANEVITPTINKAKTLIDDMGAVITREVKTIDPKMNAISDAESALHNTPEWLQHGKDYYELNKQKWAIEGKINQLKTKGQTSEINSLNNKINKLEKRIDVAGQFKVNNEGLVQSGKDTALGLRTGSTDIMDLATGEKFPISTSVPSEGFIHKLEGDKVVKSIDDSILPQASPEYNTTVKKNIDFIENQIPGAKVFGSAKNVAETEIPHIIGDYDVLMSQTQYDKFAKANPSVGNNGFAELHNIPGAAKGVDPIDINIIQEKGGKAIGTRAEELFKQMAPDEYYAAAKQSIKNKSEIKIPYSSQELVDMSNPTTKSVVDAYESSKPKHVNKIDALINYGKPSVVAEGQQQFVNSLVGSKGSIGHQFPLEQLSNAETNAEILDKIGFIGNKKLVAADSQRMQLAINDYYMNNSILARQVDKDKINKIEASIKEYYPGAGGGAVNGIGQNHVTLGFPNHGDKEILSMKQLGMNLDTADPLSYINSIEHQISGEKLFSQEERTILSDILANIKMDDRFKDSAKQSENTSQLIENLPYSEEGKKALYEFGKQTNRTMVKKAREYGNSSFVATLRDFDDAIDAMQYQLIDKEYMNKSDKWLKSFDKRTQAAENATRNQANISTDLELLPKQFKAIKGYVEGGIEKANERLVTLTAERKKIGDDIAALSDKAFNKKYKDEIDRLNAFNATLKKEVDDMSQMRRDLYARKIHLNKLEDKMKTVGILGGGAATLIGLGVGHSKHNSYSKKRRKEYQKEMMEKMNDDERKEYQRKIDSIQQRENRPFTIKAAEWFVTPIGEYKKNGGNITKAKDGNQLVKLDQLTNFTNYNKPQPGGWLNKYN